MRSTSFVAASIPAPPGILKEVRSCDCGWLSAKETLVDNRRPMAYGVEVAVRRRARASAMGGRRRTKRERRGKSFCCGEPLPRCRDQRMNRVIFEFSHSKLCACSPQSFSEVSAETVVRTALQARAEVSRGVIDSGRQWPGLIAMSLKMVRR